MGAHVTPDYLVKMTVEAEKFQSQVRKMEEQIAFLAKRLREVEDEEAWQEGHDILCKRSNCGHTNPRAH